MRIYAVRHGETDWNVIHKIQGSTDIPLNENGINQAIMVSKIIEEQNIEIGKVYTSPYKRASMTADVICKEHNIPCEIVNEFRELCFGKWEGLNWEIIRSKYLKEYEEWENHKGTTKIPGGESYLELSLRLLPRLLNIIENSNENIMICTHGAVIMCLTAIYREVEFDDFNSIMKHLKNGSITEFDSIIMKEKIIKYLRRVRTNESN